MRWRPRNRPGIVGLQEAVELLVAYFVEPFISHGEKPPRREQRVVSASPVVDGIILNFASTRIGLGVPVLGHVERIRDLRDVTQQVVEHLAVGARLVPLNSEEPSNDSSRSASPTTTAGPSPQPPKTAPIGPTRLAGNFQHPPRAPGLPQRRPRPAPPTTHHGTNTPRPPTQPPHPPPGPP